MIDEADIIIVGSGASGAAAAWSLSKDKSLRIVCFEQGAVNEQSDYPSNSSDWELSKSKEFSFDPVTTDDLAGCDAAITLCDHLIARTGTIVLSSQQLSGRTSSVYAPIHICIAYTHQLVFDISDSLAAFKAESDALPSMISYATGPSRTADIEKTLVVGVHGPKEVYCFLVDKLLD